AKRRIVALEPNKLDDIWDDIERVAEALDVLERGRALVGSLEKRVARVAMRSVLPFRPRVAFIEWIDPLMAGGNWMPELIRFAGGVNLFGTTGAHSPPISWDELVAAHPDVVVVSPCGFDPARTRGEMGRRLWEALGARVALADGNAYFNRPGPRIVDSLEILKEILNDPGSGHAGIWEAWGRDNVQA